MKLLDKYASKTLVGGVLALIALMPFHALLVTWLGTATGTLSVLQPWKEALLVVLGLAAIWTLWRSPKLRSNLAKQPLIWLIATYALVNIWLVIIMPNPPETEVFGLVYNLRFLLAFLVALTAGYLTTDRGKLEHKLVELVLWTGGLVAGFAVIQALFLPADWLTHLGYGADTIMPYQPIQGSDVTRVISTLGGPNQLGAFLILPLCISLYLGLSRRDWRQAPLSALFLLAMFFSHSRSAWIGAVIAIGILLLLTLKRRTLWRLGIAGGTAAVLLGIVIATNIQTSSFLQATILHSDYDRAFSASSNTDHFLAIADGAETINQSPLGVGPGSAGPASEGSINHLIAESYYMQLGIEAGLLGLAIFLALMYVVSKQLYKLRDSSSLAIPLLASFWGVAFINFLLHAWTDSTLALVWWLLAGLVLSSSLIAEPRKAQALDLNEQ